ncbi:hypothetical protein [Pedobacter gandavensis]|uniref:hypothetical protein n=1 Tax=Pedobacter gandavensis TaxID=2679963 RepID=UPI00292CAE6F|nr:hypothetical protein [Pedobacter gandavensis]
MLYKFSVLILVLVISGCVMDRKSEVVAINNNTTSGVLVVQNTNTNIADSLVFNGYVDQIQLSPGEITSIWVPYISIKKLPNSEKTTFSFFNVDSLEKYRKLKKMKGIIKSSLIRKFSIQLNKVQDPVDMVYVIEPF